ncbi:Gnt-I system low-affinity gluconate transporter [Cyclobacterium xiamenense]|uniref:Gnt-I system low-affinity gluconate transporter n=1 Tax=Cyclobacterium xiamenense TaxID=1297121 RepID=A0A1H6UC72_9BACT|nr:gluconate:H+ symporter [Cyclobacterium xiamenense]SEI85800.1 Gnt-I system low-affinity gluconate transporter [Cyclobacterium xiamenense]
MDQTIYLFLITSLSILLLLVLVMKLKVHAFISLLLASCFVGLAAGMPFPQLLSSLQKGMGDILGFITIVVGLGAILGKLLEVSGGAQTMAHFLIRGFGEKRTSWALMLTGFIVSIPVFLDVGFIILIPLVYALAHKAKKSLLHFAVPLLAGMAVTHAFIPPTPGPVAVAEIISAPLGWMILFGAVIGLPCAILAGPVFGGFISKRIFVPVPAHIEFADTEETNASKRDFFTIAFIIVLPLFLILIATSSDMFVDMGYFDGEAYLVQLLQFLGHPFIALTIATLVASYFLGFRKGFKAKQLLEFSDKALAPAGLIIVITGAGGMFKEILVQSGAGEALAAVFIAYNVAPIVMAYLIAVVIRVIQGSATVAMVTAAGMIAPVISGMDYSDPQKALIGIAIAAGSCILSHVNDSGFWLVKKYLDISEKETLQTWTVLETIISLTGFVLVLLLSLVIQ